MAEGGPLGLLVFATILALIDVLAFSIRLFSVIKYESIIHEFDPYFNYKATQYLSKAGIYEFWNWFDDRTWYPLGRVIGGTVYAGLTLTAGTMWWLAQKINIPLSVETVCVFTAPVFSAFASWATFLLTKVRALLSRSPENSAISGSFKQTCCCGTLLKYILVFYIVTLRVGSCC